VFRHVSERPKPRVIECIFPAVRVLLFISLSLRVIHKTLCQKPLDRQDKQHISCDTIPYTVSRKMAPFLFLLPSRRTCNRRCLFVCLFVCLLATFRKNFRKDLHEIFREGWQCIRIATLVRRALAEVCTA